MGYKNLFFGVVVLLLLQAEGVTAQQADTLAAYDSDELFSRGRKASFDGNRTVGRVYLQKALEKSPNYADVRIFLARTYLWDDMPDQARETLQPLLVSEPNNLDAAKVMFDAAFWNDDPATALEWANKGLTTQPSDKEMMTKKAQALGDLERYDEAMAVLDVLLQRFPGDKTILGLWNSFDVARKVNSLTASADYDFYTDIFGTASMYSLQYGRKTGLGSVLLRVNEANRFGTNGWQVEADAYPSIAKGLYAYLNYGYSPTALFPDHRVGAELYASLPWAFEASGGIRYLYFGPGSDVLMYTGTLGKYHRNLWFSARVFITPDPAGASRSLQLQVRRYFADPAHFVGLLGGFGFSPDFRNLQSNDGLSTTDIYRLKSNRVAATYQRPVGKSWQLAGDFGYGNQEYLFDVGSYIGIWTLSVRVRYAF